MIDLSNRKPRKVITPDGEGNLFYADQEEALVKVQVGDRRYLRVYKTEQVEGVKADKSPTAGGL